MRVEWISYKGKKILCMDFSGVTSQDEMVEILRAGGEEIKKSPGKVLNFVDMTNASAGPDFMKASKAQGKELLHKAGKTAIIGITGLKSMLLKGYNLFSGDSINPFSTREDALDYLVS